MNEKQAVTPIPEAWPGARCRYRRHMAVAVIAPLRYRLTQVEAETVMRRVPGESPRQPLCIHVGARDRRRV
jgi:hypothetical protein